MCCGCRARRAADAAPARREHTLRHPPGRGWLASSGGACRWTAIPDNAVSPPRTGPQAPGKICPNLIRLRCRRSDGEECSHRFFSDYAPAPRGFQFVLGSAVALDSRSDHPLYLISKHGRVFTFCIIPDFRIVFQTNHTAHPGKAPRASNQAAARPVHPLHSRPAAGPRHQFGQRRTVDEKAFSSLAFNVRHAFS